MKTTILGTGRASILRKKGGKMRLIDADALVTGGAMIMVVGFFVFVFGFLVMMCALMIGDIL